MPFISDFLYPELRGVAPAERVRRLKLARQVPLDALELFGLAAGLVAVTALTRCASEALDAGGRLLSVVANSMIALPLLTLFLGPFHIRRMRRGLRECQGKNDKAPPSSYNQ